MSHGISLNQWSGWRKGGICQVVPIITLAKSWSMPWAIGSWVEQLTRPNGCCRSWLRAIAATANPMPPSITKSCTSIPITRKGMLLLNAKSFSGTCMRDIFREMNLSSLRHWLSTRYWIPTQNPIRKELQTGQKWSCSTCKRCLRVATKWSNRASSHSIPSSTPTPAPRRRAPTVAPTTFCFEYVWWFTRNNAARDSYYKNNMTL